MIFKQFFDSKSFTYSYLIASEIGTEACIIDPVFENINDYLMSIKKLKLKLVKVIDTHIHADHISGITALKEKTNCATIMGKSDSSALIASIEVKDQEIIKIGKMKMLAMYTPGHTSDSYSFKLNDRVFTGDVLLISGTGRTDLQNGDAGKSYDSIFNILLKLKENTLVYPAHDYKGETFSTIKREKAYNPRLQVKNKKEYVNLMKNLKLPNPKLMDLALPLNKTGGISLNQQKEIGLCSKDIFKEKKSNFVFIDIREDFEKTKKISFKNILNIPSNDLNSFLEKKYDPKKIFIICCNDGFKSYYFVKKYNKKYNNLFNLTGGFNFC